MDILWNCTLKIDDNQEKITQHRLFIDNQYQSINRYQLVLYNIDIDCHRLSTSLIGHPGISHENTSKHYASNWYRISKKFHITWITLTVLVVLNNNKRLKLPVTIQDILNLRVPDDGEVPLGAYVELNFLYWLSLEIKKNHKVNLFISN